MRTFCARRQHLSPSGANGNLLNRPSPLSRTICLTPQIAHGKVETYLFPLWRHSVAISREERMGKSHSHVAKLPVSRRKFLLIGAAVAAPSIARSTAPARAQGSFPTRPIRLIIPWTAGSTADLQMRSLAQLAQASLGQAVIIENRPGAGGTLHAAGLATGQPD